MACTYQKCLNGNLLLQQLCYCGQLALFRHINFQSSTRMTRRVCILMLPWAYQSRHLFHLKEFKKMHI